jgi:putative N-acetylmannosamine-6-phosphate epimerase
MASKFSDLIAGMAGGLIVSVQADAGGPLDNPHIIAALAQSVAVPGCVGLRIDAPDNIRATRVVVELPIIGIYKSRAADGRVWITPTFEAARACVEAGATVVALDATTSSPRPFGQEVSELIACIHAELGVPVVADISNLEEALAAARAGADLVASTLSGYVHPPFAAPFDPPDVDLISALAAEVPVPVIAEGRYNTPELARQALQAGALAVVVGSAITRPAQIATSFVRALASCQPGSYTSGKKISHNP